MGKPDGAHTHGHGGSGAGLNGFADVLNQYVLLPIAAVIVVASFLHVILLALLCIGAFTVAAGVGFVCARRFAARRVRRLYGSLPPGPTWPPLAPPAYRPPVEPQRAGQLTPGEDLRRAITRALLGRERQR